MTESSEQLDVRVSTPCWGLSEAAAKALVKDVVDAVRSHCGPLPGGALEVWFADDDDVQALNRRFRRQDRPTNVLSFAAPSGQSLQLGQLVLACGVCDREAGARGVDREDHARHLVTHGLLHLLGHDHESNEEAERMEAQERAIMAAMGLHDPYILKDGKAGD